MIFSVPNHIEWIRNGLGRSIGLIKTQTRRPNRGIYQVGKSYAVQRKRGVKAEADIRIVMDRIWREEVTISDDDAWMDAKTTSSEYEVLYQKIYKSGNIKRWVFKFHVVEVTNGT